MAADSDAEKMLIKLLLHNKLITKSQVERILKKTVTRSDKKLHEEMVERKFVDPAKMKKVVAAVEGKGLVFPLLCDQTL
jgi:transcriptional regulator CtsR